MSRVALVTGGTRGIGAETAKKLQAAGYRVAVNYAGNEEAAKAFTDSTGIPAYKWDVSNYDECEEGVATVEKDLAAPIDVLVNNAGITRDAFLHKMTSSQWAQVVDVNLTSLFNMVRQVIGGMRTRGFGRIIVISSINGQKGQIGQANYAAAKAGAIGFVKALAQENASKGITVNAICPGYINTEMVRSVDESQRERIVAQIPVARLGEAEEIARSVVFAASDESGFMTGSTLSINGGQYMT